MNVLPMTQQYSKTSWLLVISQLACFLYLFTGGPWLAHRIDLQIWQLSGALITISGLLGLKWHSFGVFPEPKIEGRLVTTGIYAYIRHPMYAGILVVCITLVWQYPTISRLLVWLFLACIFVIKIIKEENFLVEKFPEYADYKTKTNRLIPFIW